MVPAWFFWTFFALFLPFSLMFFALARFYQRRFASFLETARWVDGVVVKRDVQQRRDGDSYYNHVTITVEYRDHNGKTHHVTNSQSVPLLPSIGETTPVCYDASAPSDARLRVERGGVIMTFVVAGAAFLFVAVGSLVALFVKALV